MYNSEEITNLLWVLKGSSRGQIWEVCKSIRLINTTVAHLLHTPVGCF